jgi:hypothetical protein
VANLTLSVTAPHPTPYLLPPATYAPFLVQRGGDVRLELTEEPAPAADRSDLLFDSGSVWKVYRRPRGYLYTFETPVADPPLYKAVDIDAGLTRGRLHFPRPRRGRRPRFAPAYPLDELLFQHRFAREGSAEVHALGVVLGGRAVLLCGQSGAGKSTLARLFRRHAPKVTVLSDDRIVLRPGARGVRAHGTPWHGDAAFAVPQAFPLGAVFFLQQGEETRVLATKRPLTAARLFSRTFPPPWDEEAVARVLALCARVAETVPCYTLRFRRDASAVAAVRETVRA